MSQTAVMEAAKVRTKGGYLEVRIPARETRLTVALQKAGARYSMKSQAWRLPATPAFAGLMAEALRGVPLQNSAGATALLDSHRAIADADRWKTVEANALPSIPFTKTKPREHQLRAYHFAFNLRSAMLMHWMGTGKSKVVVDLVVNRGHRNALILCPKSVIAAWPRQFETHGGMPVYVAAMPSDGTPVVGQHALALRHVETAKALDWSFVLVLNYERALIPPFGPTYTERKNAKGEVEYTETDPGWLLSMDWDLLVLDESHRLKAPSGVRARFIERLAGSVPWKLALTGTPLPHSPMDAYKQFRILDSGILGTRLDAFREKYAVMGGFQGKNVVGYKNLDDLSERMARISIRAGREVLSLPEPMPMTRTFELNPKAKRAYRQMEREMWTRVQAGDVTAANAAVKSVRLQQIASGYVAVDDAPKVLERLDDTRVKLLSEILEDIDSRTPVVVFARFVPDLDAIQAAAKAAKRPCLELSGRKNELDRWQKAKDGEVLAVQYQAGGVGIDLTRSPYCVHYSHTWSLGDYDQAVSRVDREGQRQQVVNIHMVAEGTVDGDIIRAHEERRAVADVVLDGMRARNDTKKKGR